MKEKEKGLAGREPRTCEKDLGLEFYSRDQRFDSDVGDAFQFILSIHVGV